MKESCDMKKRTVRWARAVSAALLAATLAGCGGSDEIAGAEGLEGDPLIIGVIMDTSGTASFYSEQAVQMIEYAAEATNKGEFPEVLADLFGEDSRGILNRPVEIVTEDDGSDPNRAVQAARKLIAAGADAIISTSGSASALQSRVVCEEESIPCIAPYSSSGAIVQEPNASYVFTIAPNSTVQGAAFSGIFTGNGYETYAIVGDSSPTSAAVADLYQAAFDEAGLEMVAREVVPVGSTDATAQVSRVRSAQPDLVFDSFASLAEEGLFYKSAGDSLDDIARWANNGIITSDEPAKVAGAAIAGVKTLDVRSEENTYGVEVQDSFSAANPDLDYLSWTTICNWEAFMVLKYAFEQAGSTDGADVRAEIEALQDFPSVLGPPGYTTSFSADNHNGSSAQALVPVVLEADGAITLADDEKLAD